MLFEVNNNFTRRKLILETVTSKAFSRLSNWFKRFQMCFHFGINVAFVIRAMPLLVPSVSAFADGCSDFADSNDAYISAKQNEGKHY